MPPVLIWRGQFTSKELNALQAEAFRAPLVGNGERDWWGVVSRHSLGWVVAREGENLVGFVNVPWDGLVHAWIQDTMVSSDARRLGIGSSLVAAARKGAMEAGCDWLHVDFPPDLAAFYLAACGFVPTTAGLIDLTAEGSVSDAR